MSTKKSTVTPKSASLLKINADKKSSDNKNLKTLTNRKVNCQLHMGDYVKKAAM